VTLPATARADTENRSTFGVAGLVEMPNARMQQDGEISAGATYFLNNERYNLDMQFLPWLDASFRYSGLKHFDTRYSIYWDRSLAVKLRLWQESDLLPSVALGINDVVGTGVYAGEYLVASKRFGDFDATLGMGWGRLGSAAEIRNPLSLLSKSFDNRQTITVAGGTGNFNELFHGRNVGIFGGLAWQTPLDGLTLMTEYSSDAYERETLQQNFTPKNQVNFGASYQYGGIVFGLDYLYGKALGGSLTAVLDPTQETYPVKLGPELPAYTARTPEQQQQALNNLMRMRAGAQQPLTAAYTIKAARNEFVDALMSQNGDARDITMQGTTLRLSLSPGSDLRERCAAVAHVAQLYEMDYNMVSLSSGDRTAHCEVGHLIPAVSIEEPRIVRDSATAKRAFIAHAKAQNLIIESASFRGGTALIYYTNAFYYSETEALARLTRLLSTDAPPDIEKFRLIAVVAGRPQREFDILRAPLERGVEQNDDPAMLFNNTVQAFGAPLDNPVLALDTSTAYPAFSWFLSPQFRQALFDPSHPIGIQLALDLGGEIDITPQFSLSGAVEASLYDDFPDRESDSVLPHVRTDFDRYFAAGKTGIADLESDYRFRLAPDVYAIGRAGYLESMFAGVGGEVLWRPEGARWALGADLFEVWQRNFDRLFGLQPYHVTTGLISLYYASPWYDLNFAVRAGQYLAGDRGVTLELTRRFSTGVEIGAFMTKTNVSSADFGEGSFDKGIFIRIPLDWALPLHSQSTLALDLRPVQRDGGQRLVNDAILYQETRRTSEAEMYNQADLFTIQ
jgi:hypothetical protein